MNIKKISVCYLFYVLIELRNFISKIWRDNYLVLSNIITDLFLKNLMIYES